MVVLFSTEHLLIKALSNDNPNFFKKHSHEIASVLFTFNRPNKNDRLCIMNYEISESPLEPSVVYFNGIADAYRDRSIASQMISQAVNYYTNNQAGLVDAITVLTQ